MRYNEYCSMGKPARTTRLYGGHQMGNTAKDFLYADRLRWRSSLRELKRTRNLTLCAMLLAMSVALDYVGGVYLPGGTTKITFAFLGTAVAGALFGPFPAMLNGALCDIIMCVLKPAGAYFPGYTLTALLGGLVYGLLLYRRGEKQLYVGVAIAKLLVNLVLNIGLNTVWTSILYGKAFFALLATRAAKNLLAYPVEVALLLLLLLALRKNAGRLNLADQFRDIRENQ